VSEEIRPPLIEDVLPPVELLVIRTQLATRPDDVVGNPPDAFASVRMSVVSFGEPFAPKSRET
jgi:hypothetical protein